MCHGLAGRETLRGFSELLGLDLALDPAVEDFDHGRARLQALGSHRPDCIHGYVRPSIDHGPRIPPGTAQSNRAAAFTAPPWPHAEWLAVIDAVVPDRPAFYSGLSAFSFRIVRLSIVDHRDASGVADKRRVGATLHRVMTKTSVYLTPEESLHLKRTAARTGRSQAELIREGVRLVTAQSHETPRTFHSLGKGRGGASGHRGWDADELYRSVTGHA